MSDFCNICDLPLTIRTKRKDWDFLVVKSHACGKKAHCMDLLRFKKKKHCVLTCSIKALFKNVIMFCFRLIISDTLTSLLVFSFAPAILTLKFYYLLSPWWSNSSLIRQIKAGWAAGHFTALTKMKPCQSTCLITWGAKYFTCFWYSILCRGEATSVMDYLEWSPVCHRQVGDFNVQLTLKWEQAQHQCAKC